MNNRNNSLNIFIEPIPSEIRDRIYSPIGKPHKSTGFVYALECGDYVKIGQTTKPDKRFYQIRQGAHNYGGVDTGRMAVSARIENYIEKEHELHSIFAKLRKEGTELFSIPFEAAAKELVRDDDEGAEIDESIIRYEFGNDIQIFPKLHEICRDGANSQLMLALLSLRINKMYSYVTLTPLSLITNLSIDKIQSGLNRLEEMGVIRVVKCGCKQLVKFIY